MNLVPKIRPNRCVGGYKQVVPCGELFSCASQVRGGGLPLEGACTGCWPPTWSVVHSGVACDLASGAYLERGLPPEHGADGGVDGGEDGENSGELSYLYKKPVAAPILLDCCALSAVPKPAA